MADAALCGAGRWAGICASRAGDAAPALVAVARHPSRACTSVALCLLSLASFATGFAQQMQRTSSGWGSERARILAELEQDGKRHLVIVRYGSLACSV